MGDSIFIPKYVEEVMEELDCQGHRAYIVGGAVRDSIMAREVHDYDLATDALPEEIEEIFKDRDISFVGKKFGTLVLRTEGEDLEITSFREDLGYKDGRKPEAVRFTKSLEKDLARRDFTINALAYNKKEGLIDLWSGLEDMEKGIIRTVGDPRERFSEDYLRILRAMRFSSMLKFQIEAETRKAIEDKIDKLLLVSRERLRDEFFKMLLLERPSDSIELMDSLGALELLFPSIHKMKGFDQRNINHKLDLYQHSLCVLDGLEPDLSLRLAGLFHDIAKPESFSLGEDGQGHFYGHNKLGADRSRKILADLNSPKKLMDEVYLLIYYHLNYLDDLKRPALKRLLNKLSPETTFKLFKLQKADLACSNGSERALERIEARRLETLSILNKKEVYTRKDMEVNGRDLMEMGFEEGKLIGKILDDLFNLILEDESKNKKSILLDFVRENYPSSCL